MGGAQAQIPSKAIGSQDKRANPALNSVLSHPAVKIRSLRSEGGELRPEPYYLPGISCAGADERSSPPRRASPAAVSALVLGAEAETV